MGNAKASRCGKKGSLSIIRGNAKKVGSRSNLSGKINEEKVQKVGLGPREGRGKEERSEVAWTPRRKTASTPRSWLVVQAKVATCWFLGIHGDEGTEGVRVAVVGEGGRGGDHAASMDDK